MLFISQPTSNRFQIRMNPSTSPDYSVNYSSSSTPADKKDEGVVITPSATNIVIKTRLVTQKYNPFAALSNDRSGDSSYVPPSLSNIAASPQNHDTKVFINVCTHSIVELPSQCKTLDESGWRLPMSIGDLRPFYDKGGNACIAADCIINPKIAEDMKADPSHFHFVCDLIIQCAERKFKQSRFGGRSLECSFKLPKMKYAGYVDERTNIPILPKAVEELRGGSSEGGLPEAPSRPVVAKQRVKSGGGGKARGRLIEEIQCTNTDSTELPPPLSKVRIELFVTTEENKEMAPLLDFLTDASLHEQQPLRTLPQLEPCEENLSKSQLLKIPLPLKGCHVTSIIANCSFQYKSDLPAINVSAFLLTLSITETNSATECVLPFAVDTHQISAQYETKSGILEMKMPILQSALDFEQNADPGTRQWEIQNAFRMKSSDDTGGKAASPPKKECHDHSVSSHLEDDALPEDAYHSQDIMSRHLLQKQGEAQKSQQQKNVGIGREGAETEYIHVDDFKEGGKYHAKREEGASRESRDFVLLKAEEVLKQHLPPCQSTQGLVLV